MPFNYRAPAQLPCLFARTNLLSVEHLALGKCYYVILFELISNCIGTKTKRRTEAPSRNRVANCSWAVSGTLGRTRHPGQGALRPMKLDSNNESLCSCWPRVEQNFCIQISRIIADLSLKVCACRRETSHTALVCQLGGPASGSDHRGLWRSRYNLSPPSRRLNKGHKALRSKLRRLKFHDGPVQQPVSFRASPKRNLGGLGVTGSCWVQPS
jgi:hypothetical protein